VSHRAIAAVLALNDLSVGERLVALSLASFANQLRPQRARPSADHADAAARLEDAVSKAMEAMFARDRIATATRCSSTGKPARGSSICWRTTRTGDEVPRGTRNPRDTLAAADSELVTRHRRGLDSVFDLGCAYLSPVGLPERPARGRELIVSILTANRRRGLFGSG
jgi:hypothetical protein